MEKICGIYKITNTVNGKVYIGQSINIYQRWAVHKKRHLLETSECYQYPLYQAMRKYGVVCFDFSILEQCSREQLNEREIFYIQQYHSNEKENGYNQTMGGDTQEHAKKLTDEDIDKIIMRLKTSYDSANIICKEFGVCATLIRDINRGDIYHRDNETYPIRQKLYKLAGYYESQGRTAYSTSLVHKKRAYQPKKTKLAITNPQKSITLKPDKAVVDICPICGEVKTIGASMCLKCKIEKQHKANPVANCPEMLELAQLVVAKGFESVGRDFGVSGNTIKKWCISKGLPHKKQELQNWYYTHTNTIPPITTNPPTRRKITEIVKRVNQIDLHTQEVIKVFDSPTLAAKSISDKADDSHISQVCRGKRKSAYGYFWQYADE